MFNNFDALVPALAGRAAHRLGTHIERQFAQSRHEHVHCIVDERGFRLATAINQ